MSQSLTHSKSPLAAGMDGSPQQYLTFSLGGEVFALGILNVKEIIEFGNVTEIPMMPAFIRGVINLRGAVVPVIDLSARFGGAAESITAAKRRRVQLAAQWWLNGAGRRFRGAACRFDAVLLDALDANRLTWLPGAFDAG